VRVHACDARWVIEHLVADEAIDAYHAYFPDPWWKKRHHKRRLFVPATVRALLRTLKRSGSVYLVTDVEIVFREAAAALAEAGFVAEPWTRPPDDPAQSSYERKYRRQGRRLLEARFKKE
jgi:tRNA (guanine-N7-)-methyltransferase